MQRVPKRRYTDELKARAIALGESIGPAKAARQLDMSVKTLDNWPLVPASRLVHQAGCLTVHRKQ